MPDETMKTTAVILEQPGQLVLGEVELIPPGPADVVVDIAWSGISTGTERLLWSGKMPSFPGMGYPLVPGYESVGQIVSAGAQAEREPGEYVFVPGANCYHEVRGLFGGAARRVVVPGSKVVPVPAQLGEQAVLLALAATAQHAINDGLGQLPELIVGHGVLGRLLARLTLANGGAPPCVWERDPERRVGALGYTVLDPAADDKNDYRAIYDVSGDASLLDTLIGRLAKGGEVVLAGFYSDRLSFAFPPAFMREARIRTAAEWQAADLAQVKRWAASGELTLTDLITHRQPAQAASNAYRIAFEDPSCLKMVLDWRELVA